MHRRLSIYQCGECGANSSPIRGYSAFVTHLRHWHGMHHVSQRYAQICQLGEDAYNGPTDRGINMNATELTAMIGNVTDTVSRNVNQGITTMFQASTAMFNLINNSRCPFPMSNDNISAESPIQYSQRPQLEGMRTKTKEVYRKTTIHRAKKPKAIQPVVVISDSESESESESDSDHVADPDTRVIVSEPKLRKTSTVPAILDVSHREKEEKVKQEKPIPLLHEKLSVADKQEEGRSESINESVKEVSQPISTPSTAVQNDHQALDGGNDASTHEAQRPPEKTPDSATDGEAQNTPPRRGRKRKSPRGKSKE